MVGFFSMPHLSQMPEMRNPLGKFDPAAPLVRKVCRRTHAAMFDAPTELDPFRWKHIGNLAAGQKFIIMDERDTYDDGSCCYLILTAVSVGWVFFDVFEEPDA
jgi:hypothetical protein